MTHLDGLSTKVHDELKTLASKHHSFGSFMADLEVLGEKMWHNARSQSIVGDAKKAPAEPQGDEGQVITTPAEPASPVSDAGFPTSNVDVAAQPSEPVS